MEQVVLPNIRKIFVPDDGYVLYDCDLSGADAQVVAWEADDTDLKAAFRAGIDVHVKNATEMLGAEFTSLTGNARYKKRQSNKHAVHACNYGAKPPAIAGHPSINWPIARASAFRSRWFQLHPKIGPVERTGSWHHRIQWEINTRKMVTNPFGYRRVYFDRPDECFTEALAWVPQSTVALVTFYGALKLEAAYPQVEMLLQNHDSLVFQIPKRKAIPAQELRRLLDVEIPYPDPLHIPWGISCSDVSWGDVEKLKEVA